MSRFKPGDLAVIKMTRQTENLGKVTELVFSLLPGQAFEFRGISGYYPDEHGIGWLVLGDFVSQYGGNISFGTIPEKCLMPLRGDDFSHELIESINQGESVAV